MGVVDGYAAWMEMKLPEGQTIPAQYWCDDEHWMFDPWGAPDEAFNLHTHHHTPWAQHLFDNWRSPFIQLPADFSWGGETVYIVGRGRSLESVLPLLNSPKRTGRALWLNQSFVHPGAVIKPQDFVMSYESHLAEQPGVTPLQARGKSLITNPIIGTKIPSWEWDQVYGFVNWNNAPLNHFAQHLFPAFPRLVECLGISTAAMHLAAKAGAKKIVLVAQDNTDPGGDLKFRLPGSQVAAYLFYAQIAMACGILGFFVHRRTGARLVNCSVDHMVGHNILTPDVAEPMPWFEFGDLADHLED